VNQKSTIFIVTGLCAAGLFSGMGARHLTVSQGLSKEKTAGSVSEKQRVKIPHSSPAAPVPVARSTDTLETLAALDDGELYSRLALWLVDADEKEIGTYWEIYRKGKRCPETSTLIFLSWTRLNPQAAFAAAGSEDAESVWRAWACNDPAKALVAARAAGGKPVENVISGLAQFHPAWLREHFDRIPQEMRQAAISALRKSGDSENPLEMLRFCDAHGMNFDPATFSNLVSKDPWAALEWGKKDRQAMEILVSQMTEDSPEGLARLAAQSPPGEMRRTLETGLFANLIKTDPEAAFAEAKSIEVPRIAAERCAAVGLALVKSDPAKAFEMAERLYAVCPDAIMKKQPLELPGSSGSSLTGVRGVNEFMKSLMLQDPAKVMNLVTASSQVGSDDAYSFDELSDFWLQRDVQAYAGWVKDQGDPATRRGGIRKVIDQLQKDGQYRDAADWALALPDINRLNDIQFMFNNWGQKNGDEARAWLKSADLPEEEKLRIGGGAY